MAVVVSEETGVISVAFDGEHDPRPRRQEPAQHALQVPGHRPLSAAAGERHERGGRALWGLRLLALAHRHRASGSASRSRTARRCREKVVEASVSYNRPRGYDHPRPGAERRACACAAASRRSASSTPTWSTSRSSCRARADGAGHRQPRPGRTCWRPTAWRWSRSSPTSSACELDRRSRSACRWSRRWSASRRPGAMVGEPEVFPNQVLVTGPESLLGADRVAARPRPISLDGHAVTFEETVPVVPPDPLIQIVQPSRVTRARPDAAAARRPDRRPARRDGRETLSAESPPLRHRRHPRPLRRAAARPRHRDRARRAARRDAARARPARRPAGRARRRHPREHARRSAAGWPRGSPPAARASSTPASSRRPASPTSRGELGAAAGVVVSASHNP